MTTSARKVLSGKGTHNMAMITVAIRTAGGETIGVLAERITAHLTIHPGLVIGCGGATDYDESALELTHTLSGAMVCQISHPLTVAPWRCAWVCTVARNYLSP
jgi:hypothetical protein